MIYKNIFNGAPGVHPGTYANTGAEASSNRVSLGESSHRSTTLPARPHHHSHAVGHLHRPHLPVRLAHADRLTGSTVAVNAARRNNLRRACRGKPRVKRGAACSMLLPIDRSTHVHVSVRSVRRARGSSDCHGQGATPPCYCVVVMLLRRCTRAKAHPAPFLSASKDVHLRSINEFRAQASAGWVLLRPGRISWAVSWSG